MTPTSERIGFVGLGAMGLPMARRLVAAQPGAAVFDVRESAIEELVAIGAVGCSSPKEVGDVATVVFASLPAPEILEQVARDAFAGSAVKHFVDLSTTGVEVSQRVGALAEEKGIGFLDAPVSGGPAGASAGKLSIMASGADATFATVEPLLQELAAKIIRIGDRPGQGQLTKLLNNLMSATSILITGEALTLAVKGGLDPAVFLEAINASSGRNTASSDKFPASVLTRRFDFGFKLRLMAKDTRLALAEAQRNRVPMLVGGVVQQLWDIAQSESDIDADSTEIVKMLERWSGTTVSQGSDDERS